jgi:hypothetical protein
LLTKSNLYRYSMAHKQAMVALQEVGARLGPESPSPNRLSMGGGGAAAGGFGGGGGGEEEMEEEEEEEDDAAPAHAATMATMTVTEGGGSDDGMQTPAENGGDPTGTGDGDGDGDGEVGLCTSWNPGDPYSLMKESAWFQPLKL